jgi:signal transduction histidine kinase
VVALRDGRSVLIEEVTEAWKQEVAPDHTHLEAMQLLDFRSVISVPLIARGHTLGALTFLSNQPGRRYGQEDMSMAQQLVDRAALALDNARLYREAQEAVRVREEFLSIASHELRTPLTPLQLKLSALRREAERPGVEALPSPQVAAAAELLERQVRRLAALVDELLDVTRISSGRLSLRLEELDLGELLQEVVERLLPTARQAGCVVHVQAPSAMRGAWDRLRLEQVVTNLLTNALKYGAGRPVRVGLSRDREQVCLAVEDCGIGISPEHQARIFGLFERAVSDQHYGGLGLGLYIAQRIVAAHGGQVLVSSVLGEGSRFEVWLPLRPAARAAR